MARKPTKPMMYVCHDAERRTCLEVHRDTHDVDYIPLTINTGLDIHTMSITLFEKRFTRMPNYPAERAAKLYAGYAVQIGATPKVMDILSQFTDITAEDHHMATTRKAAKPAEKPAVKALKAATTGKPGSQAKAKTPIKTDKKPSAANMFQELIMEGKLTDEQIFEKVQAAFDLDDSKKSYVKWYRNHLKKQGKQPPEPKVK